MFSERENRMMPSDGKDILLYILLGLLVVVAAGFGLAEVTTLVACGAWPQGINPIGPILFVFTGDSTVFGTTTQGCVAPAAAIISVWVAVAVVLIAVSIVVIVKWRAHLESDEYFIKQLRKRRGFAKSREVYTALGKKAAVSATGKVRPTIPKDERTPEQGNFPLGEAESVPCWISLEESVLLIGPPRSGKGVNYVINVINDAPGPVITTSSRADNYMATAPLRAKKGPVILFDPQGLTGKGTTMKWSPITGCDNPMTANQRATSLIGAAGLSADGNNSEWRAPGITVMQCLLHAAALAGESVDTLMRWGQNPTEARKAVEILHAEEATGRAAVGWWSALEGVIMDDPKMRGNKWFGVTNAVSGLAVGSVRDALTPVSQAETFDIDAFIRDSGTLYIMGTKSGGSSAGPFLIAMMDAITERAREIAAKRPGNRLDPPMALVLDEIANIADAWDGLVQLMADGGGVGIAAMPVLQSMAQARNNWGEQAASAIFDAATVKLQLGGGSNTQDLEVLQTLAGPREVIQSSRTRQSDGSSVSDQTQTKDVINRSELRRLPFSWSILYFRNRRPILMKLKPYFERSDKAEIDAAQALYKKSLTDQLAAGDWMEACRWKGQRGGAVPARPGYAPTIAVESETVQEPDETASPRRSSQVEFF